MLYFDYVVYFLAVVVLVVGFWYSREQYLENKRMISGVSRRSFQSMTSAEAESKPPKEVIKDTKTKNATKV